MTRKQQKEAVPAAGMNGAAAGRMKPAGATGPLPLPENARKPLAPQIPAEELEVPPEGDRVGVLSLTPGTCRWPIGNPGEAAFRFCGRRPEQSSPYCSPHSDRAFQPGMARQRQLYLQKIKPDFNGRKAR